MKNSPDNLNYHQPLKKQEQIVFVLAFKKFVYDISWIYLANSTIKQIRQCIIDQPSDRIHRNGNRKQCVEDAVAHRFQNNRLLFPSRRCSCFQCLGGNLILKGLNKFSGKRRVIRGGDGLRLVLVGLKTIGNRVHHGKVQQFAIFALELLSQPKKNLLFIFLIQYDFQKLGALLRFFLDCNIERAFSVQEFLNCIAYIWACEDFRIQFMAEDTDFILCIIEKCLVKHGSMLRTAIRDDIMRMRTEQLIHYFSVSTHDDTLPEAILKIVLLFQILQDGNTPLDKSCVLQRTHGCLLTIYWLHYVSLESYLPIENI